jgi:hypothetical protein
MTVVVIGFVLDCTIRLVTERETGERLFVGIEKVMLPES